MDDCQQGFVTALNCLRRQQTFTSNWPHKTPGWAAVDKYSTSVTLMEAEARQQTLSLRWVSSGLHLNLNSHPRCRARRQNHHGLFRDAERWMSMLLLVVLFCFCFFKPVWAKKINERKHRRFRWMKGREKNLRHDPIFPILIFGTCTGSWTRKHQEEEWKLCHWLWNSLSGDCFGMIVSAWGVRGGGLTLLCVAAQ